LIVTDIVLESFRVVVLMGIVLFLWNAGRQRFELAKRGWNFIIAGFCLLMFGSILDITDNFEGLNRFVVIGDTETEAVLEKVVGFLGGFLLLAIGLVRWIPTVQRLSDLVGERTKDLLEANKSLVVEAANRKRAEEAAQQAQDRLTDAIDSIPEGFALYDEDDRLVLANRNIGEMYPLISDMYVPGTPFEEVLRTGVDRGQFTGIGDQEEDWIEERLQRHRNPTGAVEFRLTDGRYIRVAERHTRDGGTVGVPADITEIRRAEAALRRLAYYDTLTGLPSLRLGKDRLNSALAGARRRDNKAALMFVDLDGFKAINDTLGHEAGDHVLKEVARRLLSTVRETDTVFRIGGDEFSMVLTDVGTAGAVVTAAEKVIVSLSRPFSYHGEAVAIRASIGIALYPDHGESPDELVRRADAAMYASKREGPGNYRFAGDRPGPSS
jgi:diguanylate cyclase (GGDEF)-like protein